NGANGASKRFARTTSSGTISTTAPSSEIAAVSITHNAHTRTYRARALPRARRQREGGALGQTRALDERRQRQRRAEERQKRRDDLERMRGRRAKSHVRRRGSDNQRGTGRA